MLLTHVFPLNSELQSTITAMFTNQQDLFPLQLPTPLNRLELKWTGTGDQIQELTPEEKSIGEGYLLCYWGRALFMYRGHRYEMERLINTQ